MTATVHTTSGSNKDEEKMKKLLVQICIFKFFLEIVCTIPGAAPAKNEWEGGWGGQNEKN